ncbi:ubiquitin carboxyl-terminal hydrolase 2-like [Mercenaria mercenaria]|uniref:ubiquitin carboxyl-terminal hydrolase 2-like n=1 Tax=Mercenaria mercenaria TaxID=6596 RepID=UPI00234E6C91|nr:ubiquitin carboxyl-terminal hydrolase 2-like [Mercenaria mercenaria]
MSYRVSILSPMPTYGLGTMPGSKDVSTYSTAYHRRSGSASRKYGTIGGSSSVYSTGMSSSSRPSSRPLPVGPGPLDHSGRKLNSFTSSDIRKNSTSSLRAGPLRADHSYQTHSKFEYTPSVGSLNRKYSPISNAALNSTTKDFGNRSLRSRSVSNTDRLTENISNIRLNGVDSVKASPRTNDSDDSIYGSRESRKDRHEQNLNDTNIRGGSRISRISNGPVSSTDDIFTPKNRDSTGRATSIQRENENKRRDSINDIGVTKSLSRQSSSSSISTGTSKYNFGGKVGLRNIGNTCFMNSVLQCLSNTRPLLEYTLKEDYVLDKNKTTSKLKGALIIAYANLITSFWKDKSSSYVSPNSFKSQIQKFAPRFSGYQQQDAQEFLRYLLEGLHEDVNKVTQKPKPLQINDDHFSSDTEKAAEYWNNYLRYDHSKIVEIFVGQLKSELKFDECGHRSVTFDPFWDLSLPIPKTRSECEIIDCLSLFMKVESLDGDESPTCAKCKKRRSCTKRFSIQKFPPILVLHLKRFSQERYSRKITTLVNFPIKHLDLTEFAAEKGQQTMYNLYAVSEHSGTTYGGHYTAKCKHPYTGEWNSFNDTHVSSCGANQSVSSEAYVLFFELVSSTGSPSRL